MSVRKKIIDVLVDAPDRTMRRQDLVQVLRVRYDNAPNINAIAQALHRMTRDGSVTRVCKGVYRMELPTCPS